MKKFSVTLSVFLLLSVAPCLGQADKVNDFIQEQMKLSHIPGMSVGVVQDGKVIEPNLKRERITVSELAAAARLEQIASIGDVAWAVVETSGQISFIPKKSS